MTGRGILCNEIPRRFHTRMQIPSSIELCRLSCRGQNERIPGFRGKRMEEKKRKGEKRKKKDRVADTPWGRVRVGWPGLTVRNDDDFSQWKFKMIFRQCFFVNN